MKKQTIKIELEDTKWIPAEKLKRNLDKTDSNKSFKKKLLDGYKNSDFYKFGL